ncbi:MAG: hypothetical protein ACWGPN_09215 [Gammaproteobacteria bacterium]
MALLILLGFSPCVAVTQDLLEGIDPDVRNGLLFEGARIDRRISREIPAVLSDFSPPQGFNYIGSSVDSSRWLAVYETTLAADDAKQRTTVSLRESGWEDYRPWMSGGVVNIHMPDPTLCRDDHLMTVGAWLVDESTYVFLSSTSDYTNCNGELVVDPIPSVLLQPTSRYLPRLVLPLKAEPVESAADPTGASMDPRGALMRNRLKLDPDLGTEYLADEYGSQLSEQDWKLQGEWSGDRTAGSSWFAIRDEDVVLSGLLQVVALGESVYEMVFHLDYFPNQVD